MNSSLSHSALMITVRLPDHANTAANDTQHENSYKESTLFLVDLAGSERSTASAGQQYKRLEEGKAINLSLSSLGNCMNALAEKRKHVPYRDSKLTRLLQGSLGGGARTSVIVTLPPCVAEYDGMILPVLKFASRAMKVRVSAKITRKVDYEALYNKVMKKLDEMDHDTNVQLLGDGHREELLERRELELEQLKEENAMMRKQLDAIEGATFKISAKDENSVFLTNGAVAAAGSDDAGYMPSEMAPAPAAPKAADPVDVEKYWREQMAEMSEKSMQVYGHLIFRGLYLYAIAILSNLAYV